MIIIPDILGRILNTYSISYTKIGKPTSTRKLKLACHKTFEEIIEDPMLNILSNKVYKIDYWYEMAEKHVTYKRIRGAGNTCTYHITFKSLDKKLETIAKYKIEIECEKNIAKLDLLSEEGEEDIEEGTTIDPKLKSKKPAKWLRKESTGVKKLLFLLAETKDIDKVKTTMSKATFYRNLKICEEKGYIKEGKLLKKVMV